MQTNAIAGSQSSSNASTTGSAKTLDKDAFLKLLITELQNQDPMNPMKDTEFISQMASFSALEQSKAMQQDLAALRVEQQLLQATGLLGREVLVQGGDGTLTLGIVSGVTVEDSIPHIVVNGWPYTLGDLRSVAPAPTSSSTQGAQP